jgi:hypothetical protein
MIFVNHIKSAKAAKDYYAQHISPGDYYGRDSAEMKGIWHGRGAEMLRLSGEAVRLLQAVRQHQPGRWQQIDPPPSATLLDAVEGLPSERCARRTPRGTHAKEAQRAANDSTAAGLYALPPDVFRHLVLSPSLISIRHRKREKTCSRFSRSFLFSMNSVTLQIISRRTLHAIWRTLRVWTN